MARLTLDEARRIVQAHDISDPALTIEAVALLLRFDGIADPTLLPIAGTLEQVADSMRKRFAEGRRP